MAALHPETVPEQNCKLTNSRISLGTDIELAHKCTYEIRVRLCEVGRNDQKTDVSTFKDGRTHGELKRIELDNGAIWRRGDAAKTLCPDKTSSVPAKLAT